MEKFLLFVILFTLVACSPTISTTQAQPDLPISTPPPAPASTSTISPVVATLTAIAMLPTNVPLPTNPGASLDLAGDWEGKSEWPGLTFAISFSIAEGSNEVNALHMTLTCPGSSQPDGNYTFPPSPISDNSFSAFGTEGKFLSSTDAAGTFNGGVRITCGQQEVPIAGEWTAKKITQ